MTVVVHVTWEYPPAVFGGLGHYVHALATAQARSGHDVTVLTVAAEAEGGGGAPAVSPLAESTLTVSTVEGVRVVRVAAGPLSAGELVEHIDRVTRDVVDLGAEVVAPTQLPGPGEAVTGSPVVHSHDWMTAPAGRALADRLRCPWVHGVHATEWGRRSGRLDGPLHRHVHAMERTSVNGPSAVVVLSPAMVTEVVGVLGATPSQVHIVPVHVAAAHSGAAADTGAAAHSGAAADTGAAAHSGGTNWDAGPGDCDAARERWAGDGPLVVAAGRLEWEKGFSTLLRALPALRRRHPAARVAIAGRGSYRPTLERLAADLDVSGAVTWTGWLENRDLAALFAVADAVVVPSRYEPYGLVARQAQAAGAPVVVTAVGGLAAAVVPGETGWTVEPGDVDGLGATVSRLLGDPSGTRAVAEAGRVAARATRPADVVAALDAIYRVN